jgi:hypothetical protein
MIFFGSNQDVVRFAADIAVSLKPECVSITIILLARSEASYVSIATDTSLENTVLTRACNYSWLPMSISTGRILAG